MNDPHVVALFYNVKHSASVDYSDAKPLEHEEDNFTITIANDKACFTMKAHYATEEKALAAVEEYIQVWELDAALQKGPTAFTLEFDDLHIEDRKPQAGMQINATVPAPSAMLVATAMPIKHPYPSPPSGLKITPDVQSMSDRWAGYRLCKEPLPSMAYFCLTVLEASTRAPKGRRPLAVKQYGIDRAVLDKIGDLSSEKGGTQARKADGIGRPLTLSEIRFLEEAIKALILKASEVAHDRNNSRAKIKLSDLPQC